MSDLMGTFLVDTDHAIEWNRVDGTSDVQRFDDPDRMMSRYREMVANEPEAIFIVAVRDRKPSALFRRDDHPTLRTLSPERQARAQYLCIGAQSRHERRWGDMAIRSPQ